MYKIIRKGPIFVGFFIITKNSDGIVSLSNELVREKFDFVYCASDIDFDTAESFFSFKVPVMKETRLNDIVSHKLYNLADFDYAKFINKKFPEGESFKDLEKRISLFLDFIKLKHAKEKIAVISHPAVKLAFDVVLKRHSWENLLKKGLIDSSSSPNNRYKVYKIK